VQGRYSREQIEQLKRAAPAVGAVVARHFREEVASDHDPFSRLETLFLTSEPLWRLTGREKKVCLRIL
jgi:hypothetical protein